MVLEPKGRGRIEYYCCAHAPAYRERELRNNHPLYTLLRSKSHRKYNTENWKFDYFYSSAQRIKRTKT